MSGEVIVVGVGGGEVRGYVHAYVIFFSLAIWPALRGNFIYIIHITYTHITLIIKTIFSSFFLFFFLFLDLHSVSYL